MNDYRIWVSYYDDEQAVQYDLHDDDTHRIFGVHHDAEGKNINYMHPVFSELVMYWYIWKNNIKSSYIGFSQYRRNLAVDRLPKKGECQVYQIGNFGSKTVYDQFAHCHNAHDMDVMLSCIDEKYGKDNPYSRHIRESHIFYARCMFMMMWADFVKLCKFVFPLIDDYAAKLGLPTDRLEPWIEKAHKELPNKRPDYNVRVIGFLSERLISAWIATHMSPYLHGRNVAIVNYNTTELTEAAIKSLQKHTICCTTYVFDNSDEKPFKTKLPNVVVIDNTKGQLIDFDKELEAYPDKWERDVKKSNYGSAKHSMSVDKLLEMIPEGFVLMDSDVLVRNDIKEFFDKKYSCAGSESVKHNVPLLLPFLCYLNAPMLNDNNIRFFNGEKMWALSDKEPDMYYDTGAWLLEEVRKKHLPVNYLSIWYYIIHLGHGSWIGNDSCKWLEENASLWK